MMGMAAMVIETKPTPLPLKIGDVIPGDGKPTPKALAHYFATEADDLAEVHSMEPWWLMQCRGSSEALACASLKKEGFEPYYPTYRKFSPMPRNKIASHMRHKKRYAVQEKRLPLYPGYVLIRPLAKGIPTYDVYRLYELDGCGGLCTWAKRGPDNVDFVAPILIPDYRVETMRAIEANGLNDQFSGISEHAVMTGIVKEVGSARTMQTRGRLIARLDDGLQSSLFIDRGDRVIRVISSRTVAEAVGH